MRKLRKRTEITPEKFYLTIDDLPLYNWTKCTDGDYRYVTRDGKSTKFDALVWVRLYNEYLERFDISDSFAEYLKTCIFLTELRCAFIESGDDSLLNQIAIEEVRLSKQDPSLHEGMSVEECLAQLSRWQGYHIKIKEITIVEFKTLMLDYVRVNQKK